MDRRDKRKEERTKEGDGSREATSDLVQYMHTHRHIKVVPDEWGRPSCD